MTRQRTLAVCASLALLSAAALAGDTSAPRPVGADGRAIAAPAPERIAITTDKPLYRPGEAIWVRAWELEAAGLDAVAGSHGVTVELVDPRGAVAMKKRVRAERGAAAIDLVLGEGVAGGRYTLRVSSDRGARAERELVVARYELPSFDVDVQLDRDSYAPGDRVGLALHAGGPDGEPLSRALVTASVWLDGRHVARTAARTDRRGSAALAFALPARIARGDALVTITVDHGGVTEAVQRRVPIALADVVLAAYPEGGDLVAGLPGRLYVRATTPLGDPAAVRAELVDDRGRVAGTVDTALRGMGSIDLAPEPGRRYRLRVIAPDELRGEVEVPAALPAGCNLTTMRDAGRAVALGVACTEAESVTVVARVRGREIGRLAARVDAAGALLRIPVPAGVQGVVTATLYRESGAPCAERLIYRGLGEGVVVGIEADRDRYAPRDPVRLTVTTRDAEGRPVPADLALSVVDRAVYALAGEDDGTLLSRLLLEPEMPGQRVDDAAYYFSGAADAARALDLLLATKGWRRFRVAQRD